MPIVRRTSAAFVSESWHLVVGTLVIRRLSERQPPLAFILSCSVVVSFLPFPYWHFLISLRLTTSFEKCEIIFAKQGDRRERKFSFINLLTVS
jgi:hypothetical protein